MRLSIAPWGETLAEVVAAARAAEEAGFDGAWTSELHRSAFVPAAAISAATERIDVGTAIALAFVRSPLITALTALDLDDLSGGRTVLGLGAGVKRLNEDWHGADYERPVQRLREVVTIVRKIVADAERGEPIEVHGELVDISMRGWERPFASVRHEIPVYLAAMAPLMLGLAGEIADGWISHELCSPLYLSGEALPRLREGLERGARTRESLRVVVSACCMPAEDGRWAKRQAAGLVAFYATVKSYQSFFELHGFGDVPARVRERFAAGDVEGMRAACPDELVDALTLAGEPDEVRERLSQYDGLADEIKLSPPTHFVAPEVTRSAQAGLLSLIGER